MFSSYSEGIDKKYGKLSMEQELELAKKIRKGDTKAKDNLIGSNLKFVMSICQRYKGQGVPLEDLVGEGNLGLIEAAKKFDPETHGEKFISFAVWYIKKYIFKALMVLKYSYRIPDRHYNDIIKYTKIKNNLEGSLGRDSTRKELLDATGFEEKRLDSIADILDQTKFVSLSDFVSKAKNITYADVVCSDQNSVDNLYSLRERRKQIYKALGTLTDREKNVIISYYGLGGEKRSLKEIGIEYNITREATRVIKNKALKKLSSKENGLIDFLNDNGEQED